MFPATKPGVYGLNETIFIVTRFSKPVAVLGVPLLSLQVGEGVTATAVYVSSVSPNDVRVAIRSTDMVFKYVVGPDDYTPLLHHSGTAALLLPNGSYIFQLATYLTTQADVRLRDYSDVALSSGKVERQWMASYPQRVELLLRDLHHTAPASLTVTLEHQGTISDIFTGVCPGKTFGRSYPRSRLGNNLTAVQPDADIGYDYFFSDSRSLNVAPFGAVRQSSSSENCTANLAIDGNTDPYISDRSVSATNKEFQPWWVLQLPANTTVSTVSIWERAPETWMPPILSYTVKQLDQFPRGYYRLRFSNIHIYDPTITAESGFIALGATATELLAVLSKVDGLGSVLIERKVLQMCGTLVVYRCSDDSEFGFGYTYQLSLIDILVVLTVLLYILFVASSYPTTTSYFVFILLDCRACGRYYRRDPPGRSGGGRRNERDCQHSPVHSY
jgi:hypothetical protein